MTSETHSLERLVEAPRRRLFGPRRRFLLFVALCLALHVALVALVLILDALFAPKIPPAEEIPVEVVVEPPAPPKQEAPPPEEPKKEEEQKKEEPKKPPPPPLKQQYIEEEPAYDAPRQQSKEKLEREAPDEATQAQKKAQPKETAAPEPSPEKQDNKPPEQAPEVAPEKTEKPSDDKPDAEVIERAEQKAAKPEEKQTAVKNKGPAKKGAEKSIAEQLASLEQLPEFKFGGATKPSPVGGGQAKTTYLTILYGMIMPHMRVPERVRGGHLSGSGIVAFYIDEMGNLTHQAVYRTSGLPDLDAAAVYAVRRAAPFPPPPRGLPHAIQFTYSTR